MAQELLSCPDSPPVEDTHSLDIQVEADSQLGEEDNHFVEEDTLFVEDTKTWPGWQWFAFQREEDNHKESYPWVAWDSPQVDPHDV